MPIYEYTCENCGLQLEKLQKISDDPLITCPTCQQDSLKKQVSAAGFRLKGSGWYETDFKGSNDNKKNLASSSDSSTQASAGSTTSTSTIKPKSTENTTTSSAKSSSGTKE